MSEDLHVWHNGYDWVVAKDEADARAVEHEMIGDPCTHDDTCDCEGDGWDQVPDEAPLKIATGEDGAPPIVTKTCAEWVKDEGRGFLCSTEC